MTLQELKNRVDALIEVAPGDTQVYFDLAGMRAPVSEVTCEIKEDSTEINVKG